MLTRRSIRLAPRCLALHASPAAVAVQGLRYNSTTPATPKEPTAVEVDPKISTIVDSISKLTLLETSALITELKTRLNIPDIAISSGVPAGGAVGQAGGAAGAAEAEEDANQGKEEEKSIFTIKLEAFDAKTKAKVIKEVKSLLGLSLVEAKKFVEAAPKVLKENVGKEDADKIKTTLEGLGAKISLE